MNHHLCERLARAVLLFYQPGPWSKARQREWRELTGSDEATTRALGTLARRVLGVRLSAVDE
jgi:hypothetical protein